MSELNDAQRKIVEAMLEKRLKPARHEISDHLDRTLPAIKIKPGSNDDVLVTNQYDTEWQGFEAMLDKYFSAKYDSFYDPYEIGKIFDFAGPASTIPSKHVACFGQSLSRTTYASLFAALCPIKSSTATAQNTGDTITITGHGFVEGDSIFLEDVGSSGLSANTQYYVKSPTTNTFQVSTSRGTPNAATGALTMGSAVAVTADTSGITVRHAPHGISGSTTFQVPDLREVVTIGIPTMGGTERTTHSFAWPNVLGLQAGESAHLLTGAESGTSAHGHNHGLTLPNHTHSDNFTASITAGTAIITNGNTLNTTNTGTATRFTNSSASSAVTISGSVGNPNTNPNIGGTITTSTEAPASNSHNNVQPGALVNKIIYTGVA